MDFEHWSLTSLQSDLPNKLFETLTAEDLGRILFKRILSQEELTVLTDNVVRGKFTVDHLTELLRTTPIVRADSALRFFRTLYWVPGRKME